MKTFLKTAVYIYIYIYIYINKTHMWCTFYFYIYFSTNDCVIVFFILYAHVKRNININEKQIKQSRYLAHINLLQSSNVVCYKIVNKAI